MATEKTAPRFRCRHRLPSPELAGFCDVVDPETGEVLKTAMKGLYEAARRSPDLRPCPKARGSRGTWNWIYRETCRKCPDAVRETAHEKSPAEAGLWAKR